MVFLFLSLPIRDADHERGDTFRINDDPGAGISEGSDQALMYIQLVVRAGAIIQGNLEINDSDDNVSVSVRFSVCVCNLSTSADALGIWARENVGASRVHITWWKLMNNARLKPIFESTPSALPCCSERVVIILDPNEPYTYSI